MTDKLVVIINSLKEPKIKQILLYEMKFLVPNYSCLQNPWLGGYRPQIPVLCPLPSTKFVEPPAPPPRTKFLGTPLPGLILSRISGLWLLSLLPGPQVHSRILSSMAVIPFPIFSPPVITLLSYVCTQPLCTAGRHSSGLTGTARHPDMQKIRIIGIFFENRLYWQFEVQLFLVTVCTCVWGPRWHSG